MSIPDLLGNRSFGRIAEAVRERTGRVIRQFVEEARALLPRYADALSHDELRDRFGPLLGRLADALAGVLPSNTTQLERIAAEHGVERFGRNYDMEGLLLEFRLLRRILFEQVHLSFNGRMTEQEILALDQAMDVVVEEGVLAFGGAQHERLRTAVDAEAKYLSFLSHDLRNNLSRTVLGLELLRRRLQPAPEFAEDVADLAGMERSILTTMEGMSRLMQAERLRRDEVEPSYSPVRLRELASEVVGQFAAEADQKGLTWELSVPEEAVINSDRELVALVLQNLVGNAVKYSDHGTIRIGAQPLAEPRGPAWVVGVSDEGPGISLEQQKRLFKAFARGETHGQPGMGLGLSIASQAASLLGGEIRLQSTPRSGSTFSVVLPSEVRAEPGAARAPYV